MTREEMCKMSFKPYMVMEVKFWREDLWVECLLRSIDFDNEVATVQVVDIHFEEEEFIVSISNIRRSRKMKVIKR